MPSSSRLRLRLHLRPLACLGALLSTLVQAAPVPAPGFGLERFYTSAPGAGWWVMDSLSMHGGLSVTGSLSLEYAGNPLRERSGAGTVDVVSQQSVADFGGALTYDRWRFYVNLGLPVLSRGHSLSEGAYAFTAPALDLGSNPDTITDVRVGADVRFFGDSTSHFRLGAGAQLFVPSGSRDQYLSDGTYRGMVRILFAGDEGHFTYAGHLGVHIRPLNDFPVPGSPRGSELLFGVAGGGRWTLPRTGGVCLVVGPEIFGASSLAALFSGADTELEGLLSARLENIGSGSVLLRVKVGAGGALFEQLAAPQWRVAVALEVYGR